MSWWGGEPFGFGSQSCAQGLWDEILGCRRSQAPYLPTHPQIQVGQGGELPPRRDPHLGVGLDEPDCWRNPTNHCHLLLLCVAFTLVALMSALVFWMREKISWNRALYSGWLCSSRLSTASTC